LKDGRRKAFEADMNREDGRKGGDFEGRQTVGLRSDAEKRLRKADITLRKTEALRRTRIERRKPTGGFAS